MPRRSIFAGILFLVLFGLLSSAAAESHARIVRLSYIDGDVEMDRHDSQGFNRAFINMPIIEGARVWTRGDTHAEIELEDGSTVRLAPETILEFREMRLGDRGNRSTLVDLQEGTVYFNVKKHGDDDLRIVFGRQEISPAKNSRFRLDLNKSEMKVAVFRGELGLLRRNGERVEIRKNETLSEDFQDNDRCYLSKGIVEQPYDAWDREREDERDRLAAAQTYRSYPSAYSYGYYDLNQYGNFFQAPGYGWMWQPYNIGYGWSPFADGSWVWYPGYGYMWVSPYAWGWTPYRYGSWVFLNGRGWCWRPGGRHFANWVGVPNIVNPPFGFRHPTPPTQIINIVNVGRGGQPRPIPVNNVPTTAGDVRPHSPQDRNMPSDNVNLGGRTRGSRPVIDNDLLLQGRAPSNNPAPVVGNVSNTTNTNVSDRPTRGGRETLVESNSNTTASPTNTGNDDRRNNGDHRVVTNDKDYNAVDYRSKGNSDTVSRPTRSDRESDDGIRIQSGSSSTIVSPQSNNVAPRRTNDGERGRVENAPRIEHAPSTAPVAERSQRTSPAPAPTHMAAPAPAHMAAPAMPRSAPAPSAHERGGPHR